MFEAKELLALLAKAGPNMKAMILLAATAVSGTVTSPDCPSLP